MPEFNEIIRIGDECKFDDSLFNFVEKGGKSNRSVARVQNTTIDVSTEKIR